MNKILKIYFHCQPFIQFRIPYKFLLVGYSKNIIVLFLCFFFNNAFSQWKPLNSNLDNTGVSAIYANDAVWLAGEYNKDVLWFSTDKGKSWKTNDKGDKIYAGGYTTIANNNGTIVAGGRDGDRGFWTTYTSFGQKRVSAGISFEVNQIVAYPNKEWLRIELQDISRSIDDGINWKSELPNFSNASLQANPFSAIEKNGLLYVGTYQTAAVSTDKGKSYQLYDTPTDKASLKNLAICNDKIVGIFSKSTTEKKDLKIYSSPLGVKPNWILQSDLNDKDFNEIWKLVGYQNHLFGIAYSSPPTNLFYSKDFGKTLTPISNGLNTSTSPLCLQVIGDTVLLGTSKGVYWAKLSEIDKAIVLSTENSIDNNVLIYPNPTEDSLTIEGLEKVIKIEIIDLIGNSQTVDVEKLTETKYQVNIEKLRSGMYFLHIEIKNQNVIQRVFKK